MADEILDLILAAARKKLLFLPHAVDQMNSPERLITPEEVEDVIFQGVVIEDYPEDARGHSCLMGTQVTTGRFVHVVCAPKDEYLAIITVYLPDSQKWEADFITRKR